MEYGGVTWEPISSRVGWWGWGAESLCEKLRDQMGKGVRGQIIMDFVFLLKSLRFIVSSAENS